jgi:hypothetical protein
VAAAAVPSSSAGGPISYDFSRLEQFNNARALWIVVAAIGAFLSAIAIWQYRRESESLPPLMGAVLASLRLAAILAGRKSRIQW